MKKGMTLFLLMLFVPWMLRAQDAPQTISLQQAIEFIAKAQQRTAIFADEY